MTIYPTPTSTIGFWQRCSSGAAELGRRAARFGGFSLPFLRPTADAGVVVRDRATQEKITSTGIVMLGLLEVILVGFLLGCTASGLHPVWKVILSLAALGVFSCGLRLLRLTARKTPGRETQPASASLEADAA